MAIIRRKPDDLSDDELEAVYEDWKGGELEPAEIAKKHVVNSAGIIAHAKANDWGPPGKPVQPNNRGRKPLYTRQYADQARMVCRQAGFSRKLLAGLFFVSERTIYYWQSEYAEFQEAIQEGLNEFWADQGEAALAKLATGFKHVEITKEPTPIYEEVPDPDRPGEKKRIYHGTKLVTTKRVTKENPPNAAALQFLLCNIAPRRWKSINKIELSGPDGGAIEHKLSASDVLSEAVGRAVDKTPKLPSLENDSAA